MATWTYYEIQVYDTHTESWGRPSSSTYGCSVSIGYASACWEGHAHEEARFIAAAQEFHRKNPQAFVRLVGYTYYKNTDDHYEVVWQSSGSFRQSNTTAGGENTMEPDINKPLTIPRQTLIDRLQENLDEEVKKREEEEAEQKKAREEVIAAIKTFSEDELYNIFSNNYTNDPKDLKWDKDNKSWVTKKVEPTQKETDLEKFVRVLGYATDDAIELTPQQELYKLL